MQALHHDDDRAFLLVIQPRVERIFEPFVDMLALGVRERIRRFERIIDDDDIAPAAGQRSINGGCESKSTPRGDYLGLRVFHPRDLQPWKDRFVTR